MPYHHPKKYYELHQSKYNNVQDSESFKRSWTLKDVVVANRSIDKIAQSIKEKKLSPFETMIFIHKYITANFAYKDGATEECRVIPGIFKSGKIVWHGTANAIKAAK